MKFKLTKAGQSRLTSFHEEVFYEYFRPIRHTAAQVDIWGGYGLETFGADLQLVRGYDQRQVWTVVDGDVDQWIVPGFQYVNRVCYLLTELQHAGVPIQFRVSRYARSLTPIGLRRRITAVKRLLNLYSTNLG